MKALGSRGNSSSQSITDRDNSKIKMSCLNLIPIMFHHHVESPRKQHYEIQSPISRL